MSRLFLRLILVAGVGMTAAACQGDSYGTPSGYYRSRHRATISRRQPTISPHPPTTLQLNHGMAMRSLRRTTTRRTAVAIPRWP